MSGGSGTGYPVMNRGPCCAQTGRSERKRGMGVGNKTILLFLGRRFFFFLFLFFFFLQVQTVVGTQLRVLTGAASSAQNPSAGSLGGLRVKVCLLSTFRHEKRKTTKRALVGRTAHFLNNLRIIVL